MGKQLTDSCLKKNMQDGIEDVDSFGYSSKTKSYLRKIFYVSPIVRQFRGYVLDIGCGIGAYLEEYSGRSIGIDAHKNNVRRCQAKKINAIKADANFFVRKNAFDIVLLSHLLEHLTEPSRVLENAYLSTKKGGLIIIVVPCLTGFMHGFNDLLGHKQFITEEYVDYYILRKFGCKKLKSYTFPRIPLPFFDRYRELRIIYQK